MSQPTDLAVKRELILFVIYWMENFVLVLISAEKDGESGLKVFVVANRAGGGGYFGTCVRLAGSRIGPPNQRVGKKPSFRRGVAFYVGCFALCFLCQSVRSPPPPRSV